MKKRKMEGGKMNRKKGFARSRDFLIAIIVIAAIGAFLIPGSYYLGEAIETGKFEFGMKAKEEKKDVLRGNFGDYPEVVLRGTIDYGDLKVSGWEEKEYEIVVTFEARARKTERAISLLDECSVALEKEITEGKPEAELKINKPRTYGNENIITKVEMHLPEKAYQIYFKTLYGDVELEGIRGATMDLSTSYGEITLRDTNSKNVRLITTYGDADISRANIENLYISGSYADLKLERVNGERMNVHTSYGDIDALNLSIAKTDIATSYGDVFAAISQGEYRFLSSYGNVKIDVAPETKIDFAAGTLHGSINIRIPDIIYRFDEEDSKIGYSKGFEHSKKKIKLDIQTTYGSIDVFQSF
jgi:DUF4097 and DUF4098 domain-containing protein YvlB